MNEVEVKARLKNPELILRQIKELGIKLSEPVRQADTVYAKTVGNVSEYMKNDHFLRIREKSDGRFIFTVKKPLTWKELTKTEHETEIKDAKELENAIFLMGYKVANKVIKERRTAKYKDYEICLDEVEKLGSFIEVEKMTNGDVEVARKEITQFLFSLGVSPDDEVHKGYDIMAIELTTI